MTYTTILTVGGRVREVHQCRWLVSAQALAVATMALEPETRCRVEDDNGIVGWFRPDGSFRTADHRR